MAHHTVVSEMKAWCLAHYESGGEVMVECWDTDDYVRLIEDDHGGDVEQAWATLRHLVAMDRQTAAGQM
jgi:hypothetical protein